MPTQIFRTLDDVACQPQSINTVGTFDGLHRGHQTILEEVRREAGERGALATVVTFSPHPQLVLRHPDRPPVKILTTDKEKLALLEAANIDRVVIIPFTIDFSGTSSESFVRDILYERIGMSGVVLGHDHGFGKNREGDFAAMERLGAELHFTVRELPPFEVEGVTVSSTRIRECLLKGEVAPAAGFLGRPYQLSAAVVRGDGRGRTMGFPTANLEVDNNDKLVPAHGVYAVRVHRRNTIISGMMNIGVRPTFQEQTEAIEVHLFDFNDDLYGERLTVEFIERLRAEQKFTSATELIEQLTVDQQGAKHVLEAKL
jgi:riboflavin kinase/FMN adenylyltransferase